MCFVPPSCIKMDLEYWMEISGETALRRLVSEIKSGAFSFLFLRDAAMRLRQKAAARHFSTLHKCWTGYIQHEQINGCTYVRRAWIIPIKEIYAPVFHQAVRPVCAQGKARIKLLRELTSFTSIYAYNPEPSSVGGKNQKPGESHQMV